MLGLCFLCLKGLEYYLDYRDNLIPGWRFDPADWIRDGLRPDQVPHVKLFFFLYWVMTALHAVHVTIGICGAGDAGIGRKRAFFRRLLFARRCHSPLLALCRHRLDIPVADALPVGSPSLGLSSHSRWRKIMSERLVSPATYIIVLLS